MAILKSAKVQASVQAREHHVGLIQQTETYNVVAALALGDVIQMMKIPAGATVVDVILSATDLDTGGTPALSLEVGDGADTDRFITATGVGGTGGHARANTHTGHGFTYGNEDTIDVRVAAAAAAFAPGAIRLSTIYTMDK